MLPVKSFILFFYTEYLDGQEGEVVEIHIIHKNHNHSRFGNSSEFKFDFLKCWTFSNVALETLTLRETKQYKSQESKINFKEIMLGTNLSNSERLHHVKTTQFTISILICNPKQFTLRQQWMLSFISTFSSGEIAY